MLKNKQASEQEEAPQSRSSTYKTSEKYLHHQQDLCHDQTGQEGLRQGLACGFVGTMKKCSISANLIRVTKNLYDKTTSAVFFNSSIEVWFRTTVGIRQVCLLSRTLFNIFLERMMTNALEDHEGTASIGGRTITNLNFADDIDGLAG